MTDERRSAGDLVSQLLVGAATVPLVIGTTTLGAGIFLGRRLIGLVSGALAASEPEPPPLRAHNGRIRASAKAAEQAARASGLLSRRRR